MQEHANAHSNIWGLLVALQPPTATNGLSFFLQKQQKEFSTDTESNNAAALRCLVPDNLHSFFFLSPAAAAASEKLARQTEAENEKQNKNESNSASGSEGALVSAIVPLTQERTTLGRQSAVCQIVLSTNPCISNLHCVFNLHREEEVSAEADKQLDHRGQRRCQTAKEEEADAEMMEVFFEAKEGKEAVRADTEQRTEEGASTNHNNNNNNGGEEEREEGEGKGNKPKKFCYILTITDFSSNGVHVNGSKVGKNNSVALRISQNENKNENENGNGCCHHHTGGCVVEMLPPVGPSAPLHHQKDQQPRGENTENDGIVVEIVNAGKKHTTEYNVSFLFVPNFSVLFPSKKQEKKNETERQGGDEMQKQQATQPRDASSFSSSFCSVARVLEQVVASSLRKNQLKKPPPPPQQQSHVSAHALAAAAIASDTKWCKRKALLLQAQYNIMAEVYRMYQLPCEQFYAFYANKQKPLGVGGFGAVHAAAARITITTTTTAAKKSTQELVELLLALRKEEKRESEDKLQLVAEAREKLDRYKEAYIRQKAAEMPHFVKETYTVARRQREQDSEKTSAVCVGRKRSRSSSIPLPETSKNNDIKDNHDEEEEKEDENVYCFAIKIVQKKRLFFPPQQNTNTNDDSNARTTAPPPPIISKADEDVLQKLYQLETQTEEREQARENELFFQRARELEAGRKGGGEQPLPPPPLPLLPSPVAHNSQNNVNSQNSNESCHYSQTFLALLHEARVHYDAETEKQTRQKEERENQKRALLRLLSPNTRCYYEKELSRLKKQKCELQILLHCRHPNIITLYEIFDEPTQICFVMEKASGGDGYGLLQPQPLPRSLTSKPPPKDSNGNKNINHNHNNHNAAEGGDGDDDGDDVYEGFFNGGPLPEFIVKMIIYQVLQGVYYLHSNHIVHRDLKLENILIKSGATAANNNNTSNSDNKDDSRNGGGSASMLTPVLRLQLEVFKEEIKSYYLKATASTQNRDQQQQQQSDTNDDACGNRGASRHEALTNVPNPLSLLYRIHVPRPFWPQIKITDFGLSHILGAPPPPPDTSEGASHTLHDVYQMNEMRTSCGTPVYAAPEVIYKHLRLPNQRLDPAGAPATTAAALEAAGYTAAVDVFSVGVIAFALLTGRAPFPNRKKQEAAKNNHRNNPKSSSVSFEYTAAINFSRSRRRRRASNSNNNNNGRNENESEKNRRKDAAASPSSTLGADAAAMAALPSLALVENVFLPVQQQQQSHKEKQKEKESVWVSDMTAFCHKMDSIERRIRSSPVSSLASPAATKNNAPSAAAGGRGVRRAPSATTSASKTKKVFQSTLESILKAIRAFEKQEAPPGVCDLERFYWRCQQQQQHRHQHQARGEKETAANHNNNDHNNNNNSSGNGQPVFELPPISKLGKDFIQCLLRLNPQERYTAKQALEHPWLWECSRL